MVNESRTEIVVLLSEFEAFYLQEDCYGEMAPEKTLIKYHLKSASEKIAE